MRRTALNWYAPRHTRARNEVGSLVSPNGGKELVARVDGPEALLRLGGRVGGVRRAARLGWSASGTDGAHKPTRVRARLGQIGRHTSELQSHSDLVCRLLLEK